MIPLRLQEIAEALDATLVGDDLTIHSVTTDSRKLVPGGLFVALVGETFDGHAFCAQVAAAGAGALLVSQHQPELACPQLLVEDTRYALGLLGRLVRERLHPKVLAITGSCGKTTVKEMCAAILAQNGAVLATQGNLNNEIGVPLTLLRLTAEHRYAVMELGANHPGEIAWTTSLAKPDVALINNVAAAHLEGFGSLHGVAMAKSEIFNGLPDKGMAIVNADSEFFGYWQHDLPFLTSFGLENPVADYQARDIRLDALGRASFTLVCPLGEVDIQLVLPGKHNVANALAAAAATQALGLSLEEIAQGLSQMVPVKGRTCMTQWPGLTLIDDTYNASVESVLAAIDLLAGLPGYRVLAFGDMGELGQEAHSLHRKVGEHAKARGLDAVLTVGPLSALTAEAAGGQHFADKASLCQRLTQLAEQQPHLTLLAKGARSSRMEEVIEFMKQLKERAC